MPGEIDTRNRFMVGAGPSGLVVLIPLPRVLTRADALNLAAYLVTLAEEEPGEFQRVLEAVQGA